MLFCPLLSLHLLRASGEGIVSLTHVHVDVVSILMMVHVCSWESSSFIPFVFLRVSLLIVPCFLLESLLPSLFLDDQTTLSLSLSLIFSSLLFSLSLSGLPTADPVRSHQVFVLQTACLMLHFGWKPCSSSHCHLPFQSPGGGQGAPGKLSCWPSARMILSFTCFGSLSHRRRRSWW